MELTKKKLFEVTVSAGLWLAVSALAPAARAGEPAKVLGGEISASVGFFTDYIFRGISQTGEDPAIQGSIDYAHDSGFYLGVWGSNVDFGDDAQLEIDVYGGFSGSIQGFDYDIGAIYYAYPSTAAPLDYWELAASLGHALGPATLTVGVNYSPDNFGETGDAVYVHGDIEVPIPLSGPVGVTLSGSLGYQDISDEANFGVPDYVTWNLGVTFSVWGLDFDVRYFDTDLGLACPSGCDARVVGSVSRSF